VSLQEKKGDLPQSGKWKSDPCLDLIHQIPLSAISSQRLAMSDLCELALSLSKGQQSAVSDVVRGIAQGNSHRRGCPKSTIYPYRYFTILQISKISETQGGRNIISTYILDSLTRIISNPG
jgi:hypothetical protein